MAAPCAAAFLRAALSAFLRLLSACCCCQSSCEGNGGVKGSGFRFGKLGAWFGSSINRQINHSFT